MVPEEVTVSDKWSERMIAHALARQVFQGKHLVVVPNCTWTGDELDLLVVTENLRIIDVEVKISRADFKADFKKDKWYHSLDYDDWQAYRRGELKRERREWPRKVWKHYYAVPKEIWKPELITGMPQRSGVILMERRGDKNRIYAHVERRAQPDVAADKISAADAVDIARLASLRMWDAYAEIDSLREEVKNGVLSDITGVTEAVRSMDDARLGG